MWTRSAIICRGRFINFTRRLDSFFTDDRNYQESNNSLVQLDLVKVAGYGGARKWVLSGRAKLDLPSTQVSLRVYFPRLDNFRASPALSLRLEMLFDRSN